VRKLINFCYLFLLAILVFTSFGYTAEVGPVTLRLAACMPPTGIRADVLNWIAEEAKERSEGRVNIEIFWEDTLFSYEEVFRGVMIGTADIGSVNTANYPKELFVWGVFNTFLLGPKNLQSQYQFVQEVIESVPAFKASLTNWNQIILTRFLYMPGAFGSKIQYDSLLDFTGKNVRAASMYHLIALKALGITPVSLPWADVYTGLDKGTIDAMFTAIDSFYRGMMDEVAPYFLWDSSLWMPQSNLITINTGSLNKLLEEDQQMLHKIGEEAEMMGLRLLEGEIENNMKTMEERSGAIFNKFDTEELSMWLNKSTVKEMPDTWAKEAETMGLPGNEIVELIRNKLKEYLPDIY